MLADAGVLLMEDGHAGGAGGVEARLVLGLKSSVLQRRPALHPADAHDHAHGVVDDLVAFELWRTPWAALGRLPYRIH